MFYACDYYDKCYEIAEDWIKRGLAYVDELDKEQMREYRGTLTDARQEQPLARPPRRGKPGSVPTACAQASSPKARTTLRAKIDMASPNIVHARPGHVSYPV